MHVQESASPVPTDLAVTAPADSIDPATALVLAWLAGKRSEHTRKAYARDLGILPQARAARAPSWLAWCAAAGTDPVTGVTEDHVTLYARALDAAGLSAATAARKLSAVSGWYAWLTRRGHIAANPASDVGRPAVDPDTSTTPGLTRDQAEAMLTAADHARGPQKARTAAIVPVPLFTGARVSEICGADVEDLGTDRGHRVLWVTRKGGKRQALALPAPTAGRIDRYLAERGDLAAVPALPGQPGVGRPRRVLFATQTGARLLPADVWRLVRRVGKAGGLPADLVACLGPHAMRHSFATLYLDSGGSLRDLQDAMGHADPRTTRRNDQARFTLDRFPGYALVSYLAPTS
jgi:integrase/recombinase XerD